MFFRALISLSLALALISLATAESLQVKTTSPLPTHPALQKRVSLVVSASSTEHLRQSLAVLGELLTKRGLRLGKLYLTHFPQLFSSEDNGKGQPTLRPEWQREFSKLGLIQGEAEDIAGLLREQKIQYSPTWVLHDLEKEQILEGFSNPFKFLRDESSTNNTSHQRRSTNVVLQSEENKIPNTELFMSFALVFTPQYQPEVENELISTSILPNCTKSEVVLQEVQDNTPGSERFDFLYFNPEEPKQRQGLRDYRGLVIPYSPYLLAPEGDFTKADPRQAFARMVGIKCLPTRFRFSQIGAKRYAEYRQGEQAWR